MYIHFNKRVCKINRCIQYVKHVHSKVGQGKSHSESLFPVIILRLPQVQLVPFRDPTPVLIFFCLFPPP